MSINDFHKQKQKPVAKAKFTPSKIRAALQSPRPEGAWPTGWF